VNDDELCRLHEEKNPGPQTAAMLSQSESSKSTPFLVPEESKQHHRDVIHKRHSYRNVDTVVSDKECSQSTEGDGSESPRTHETGSLPVSQLLTHLETRNNQSLGHRTGVYSSQTELVDGGRALVTKESRQHRDGVINTRHSYTNVVPGVDDNKASRLSKEMVNKRQTAHYMPSPTNKGGGVSAAQ
jgi:hypothetical protein